MRNVEIKARVVNLDNVREKLSRISGECEELEMCDTFYRAAHGRLKLREHSKTDYCELIQYDRPDTHGPKLSDFSVVRIPTSYCCELNSVLAKALSVRGQVKKHRTLFMVGQTRVHLDSVRGLGDFLELEVQLTDEQTIEQGQAIAAELMKALAINESDLLDRAYIDMLEAHRPS